MEILKQLRLAEVVEVQVGMLAATVRPQLNQLNQANQEIMDLVAQVAMYRELHGTAAVAAVVPVQLAEMVLAEHQELKQQVMVV
jgi:hypothetical protein